MGHRETTLDTRLAAQAADVRAELDRLLGEARRRHQETHPRAIALPSVALALFAGALVAGSVLGLLHARAQRRRLASRLARLWRVPAVVTRAIAP